MPAFIMVSGFFAKGIYKPGYIKDIAKKLIIPYLIFQIVYSFYYYVLYNQSSLMVDPLNPQWSLWFLVSLFFWNVMILVYAKWSPMSGLALAVAVGLLVGYVDSISNWLSLSRTFVFFPFFLLGYHLTRDYFTKLATSKMRILAVVAFSLIFIAFYLYPDFDYKWMLGSKPYSVMGELSLLPIGKRLAIYLLNTGMIFCFMAVVPNGKYFFTNWGKQTLYVYLLHGFFVKTFRATDIKYYFTDIGNLMQLATIALLLTVILSTKFVAYLTQPLIELRTRGFKKLMQTGKLYFVFYKRMLQRNQ